MTVFSRYFAIVIVKMSADNYYYIRVFSRYFAIVMAFIVAIAGAVGVFVGLSLLPEINHAQGTQAEAFTAFGVVIVAVLLGIMALAMSALIGLQLTKTKAVV